MRPKPGSCPRERRSREGHPCRACFSLYCSRDSCPAIVPIYSKGRPSAVDVRRSCSAPLRQEGRNALTASVRIACAFASPFQAMRLLPRPAAALAYPLNNKLAATSVFPPAASSKRIALARSAPSPTRLAIASSVTPAGRVPLLVVVVVVEAAPEGAAGGEPERTRLGCGADPGEAPRVRPDPGKPDPLASAGAFEVLGADEVEAAALLSWAAEDPTGTGFPSLSGRKSDQARCENKRGTKQGTHASSSYSSCAGRGSSCSGRNGTSRSWMMRALRRRSMQH